MSEIKKINHRLITCFQSSGRIGKSTVLEGILAWAAFAGIPAGAVDCDAEHRTLSKRFPTACFVDATRSKDEFLQLVMDLPDAPLAVADFPAQATDFLLTAMDSLRVLDALDANETRLTVLMFGADDPTATASMAKTYRALGDRADYLLVKNPARFRSQAFDESALAEMFWKDKVPVLELPALTATTIQAIEAASAEKKKHLTYAEAAKLSSTHPMCRFEIEHFLNRIFTQCEDAARVLVPEIHTTTLEIVKHLTKEVRANWTTIGLGFGMALEYAVIESLPPPPFYVHFVVFAVLAGIIQGLLRWDGQWVRTLAKKIVPSPKTKPAG